MARKSRAEEDEGEQREGCVRETECTHEIKLTSDVRNVHRQNIKAEHQTEHRANNQQGSRHALNAYAHTAPTNRVPTAAPEA